MTDIHVEHCFFTMNYVSEDLTDKAFFSTSTDLAGQKPILEDPEQLYIGKTIIIS